MIPIACVGTTAAHEAAGLKDPHHQSAVHCVSTPDVRMQMNGHGSHNLEGAVMIAKALKGINWGPA